MGGNPAHTGQASEAHRDALASILAPNCDENSLVIDTIDEMSEGEEPTIEHVDSGFCIECKDQKANFYCEQCTEDFCEVCFDMLHRTGRRKLHSTKSLEIAPIGDNKASLKNSSNGSSASLSKAKREDSSSMETDDLGAAIGPIISSESSFGDWIGERAKYIPIRLNQNERKKLRLLESALNVSEYVDKIDILAYGNKTKRMVGQIRDICAILSGLMVACDYRRGQELFAERGFVDNADFFRSLFEIGRRYKIMNPERMRSAYGKLMFMLQDSALPEVQEMLGFACVSPIKTVHEFLKERDGLELLSHEYMMLATKEIIAEGKSRSAIQLEIKQKERAIEALSQKFSSSDLSADDIRNCLYSIGDNHAYLRTNRDPCDQMLKYLTTHFSTTSPAEAEFTLAIISGKAGARLSHSHETQYHYVHQTLTLWREILNEMFMLWYHADADLLSSTTTYRLRDTGQGLNRVQACPGVSKIAHRLLHRAQKKVGYWVGSSVIHLGDRNVPNALVFIDKYNQVSRILNPIARCLEYLDNLEHRRKLRPYDQGLIKYIDSTFKSISNLRKMILADFFRGAFDGSGADNFFDAGSCIDGRLTSAWNWCSLIEKKPFYPVFLMTGFVGFDGEWAGN
ncbi:hypothetical protein DSO57_1029379 [Entomophthora muscae]|uniref:Uncharacterized protein n=1 Tax=Entomophthora muscae TaxID=34485 RepID=A0ACC2TN46_9FUNG|nr:hypothetical protein DSO57_1029379 [Entomophthora muscae]